MGNEGHHKKTEEILEKIITLEKLLDKKIDDVLNILKEKLYVEEKARFYQSLLDFVKSPPIREGDIVEIPQDLSWTEFKYVIVESVHPIHNLSVVFAPTEYGGVIDYLDPNSEFPFKLGGPLPKTIRVGDKELLHLKPKRMTFPFKLNVKFMDIALRSTFFTAGYGVPYSWTDEVENIEFFICTTKYCPDIEFVIYNPWDFQIPQIPGKTTPPPYPIFVPPILGGVFMGWRYIINDIFAYEPFSKWLKEKYGVSLKSIKEALDKLGKELLRNYVHEFAKEFKIRIVTLPIIPKHVG